MVGPRGLAIDEPHGQRWKLALELLADPTATETVIFRSIGLWMDRDPNGLHAPGVFTAATQSTWGSEFVTEETARHDLARAAQTIRELRAARPEFDRLLQEHRIEYLLLDDLGMGPVHLCVMHGDDLIWQPEFHPEG